MRYTKLEKKASINAFHAEEEEADLSDITIEGWIAVGFFWLLGATVFLQFFTRYVLNDSAAWTEEIARYLLISSVFIGMVVGVIKHNHIQVDFIYFFLPQFLTRPLSTLVDVLCFIFYGSCTWMTWLMMEKIGNNYQMTVIDLPMNIVYSVCLVGFAMCTFRSAQITMKHWRTGYVGI